MRLDFVSGLGRGRMCASSLAWAGGFAGVWAIAGIAQAQDWPQWALNPQHTGQVGVAGQALNNILSSVVYDPLVPAEMAANAGDLLAHYQVPLIDGSKIYMESKT